MQADQIHTITVQLSCLCTSNLVIGLSIKILFKGFFFFVWFFLGGGGLLFSLLWTLFGCINIVNDLKDWDMLGTRWSACLWTMICVFFSWS